MYIGKHTYIQDQGKPMEEDCDSVYYDWLECDITIVYYDWNPTHFLIQ